MTKKPELLLPAKGMDELKVAVNFGADAVYIGARTMGLRAKAKNFSFEELSAADLREVETNVNRIFKNNADRAELLKAIRREEFKPVQKISPAERGEKFEIPMLCLDFGKGAELAEVENFLPATDFARRHWTQP